MADVTFITGNVNKARYFSQLVGQAIAHQAVDTPEIQSLDLHEVVIHKARTAYAAIQKPVLVEDTSLIINSLGRLPGTFIKWFMEELGPEKICRLADASPDRSAIAGAAFAYYDGERSEVIMSELAGRIAETPAGDTGFGWNPIFSPVGQDKTLGEMDEETFQKFYVQIKPFNEVKEFLNTLES